MSYLLIHGDARKLPLADESVHVCITSPPYWGLRDYGIPGQLGLEPTPDQFVASMVGVFREVKRVLREDGTCWVNMGDSYANDTKWGGSGGGLDSKNYTSGLGGCVGQKAKRDTGLKPKDLVGIPWRLAFALQADGWYLRSDIIWAKPNPMPESVTDRPTKSHEYLFLLSKSERYYFDQEAVREGESRQLKGSFRTGGVYTGGRSFVNNNSDRATIDSRTLDDPAGRNIRSVWTIPTESYPGSHFATFPRKLVEPCIKAGTSEKGCCPVCGKGWERETEKHYVENPGHKWGGRGSAKIDPATRNGAGFDDSRLPVKTTTGWHPACPHDAAPVPCIVLDPFAGSGTTGVVALALGRQFVGVDLSREYLGLAVNRISRPHAPIQRPGKPEHYPLFGDLA